MGGKRKHAPIVWGQQPKAARTDDEGQAPSGRASAQGRTAAEIAQAEVAEFRRRQAELAAAGSDSEQAYMKSSPDVSSPEEEAHIRREGNSAHDLHEGEDVAPAEGPSRWGAADAAASAYAEAEDLDDAEEAQRGGVGEGSEQRERERGRGGAPPGDSEGGDSQAGRDAPAGAAAEGDEGGSPPPPPKKRQVSMVNECRSVECYEKLNRISEGTYGVVYRCAWPLPLFLPLSSSRYAACMVAVVPALALQLRSARGWAAVALFWGRACAASAPHPQPLPRRARRAGRGTARPARCAP